jgi:hypothetical protein
LSGCFCALSPGNRRQGVWGQPFSFWLIPFGISMERKAFSMAPRVAPPIFTRPPVSVEGRLLGPRQGQTLREWEEEVVFCSLATRLRDLLRKQMRVPASAACRRAWERLGNWQPEVDGRLVPALPLARQQEYLYNILALLWHLLDTPTPERTGMARGFLLVEHAAYLRALLAQMQKPPGVSSVRREVALALASLEGRQGPHTPPPPEPARRRFGLLWLLGS